MCSEALTKVHPIKCDWIHWIHFVSHIGQQSSMNKDKGRDECSEVSGQKLCYHSQNSVVELNFSYLK